MEKYLSKEVSILFDKYENNYIYPIDYYYIGDKLWIGDLFISIPENAIRCPLISDLLDFLREIRGIYINSIPRNKNTWEASIYIVEDTRVISLGEIEIGKTWKESIEKQIKKLYE